MGLETFDRADLTGLFPDLSAEEAARMRAAAGEVEAVRLPEDTSRWEWWPEHVRADAVDEDVQLIVLATTLTLFNNLSDWLELALCVIREQRPHLTVSATLEVACWCDPDHNMHAVCREERLVDTTTALAEAFTSAGHALVRWAGGSHDPRVHRDDAGLPNLERR